MEKLKLQRQTIKSSLTRIYNACANRDTDPEELKVRVDKADELFRQYEKVQLDIDEITSADQQVHEDAYRAEIEDKFFAIKAIFMRYCEENSANSTVIEGQHSLNDISTAVKSLVEHQTAMGALVERISRNTFDRSTPNEVNAGSVQHTQVQHELRLPQIQIPEFDGKSVDWIRFRDLFETLIHNRSKISDIEKLEYLQTKVKGEALSLIKHLKPTNANYEIAWQLLKKKYDRSDIVKKAYFQLLLDQPAMKSLSVAEAKRIYNTTNESINALKVLNEPVQHWDSILLFILEKKIDTDTHMLWHRAKKAEEEAKLQDFLDFLERRVFELENIQKSSTHSSSQGTSNQDRRGQSRAYTAVVQTCPVCSKDHFLYNCNQFKDMNVEARHNVVQRSNLCFNCLRPNHKVANCKSDSCRRCSIKHNTLLHPIINASDHKKQGSEQKEESTHIHNTVSVNNSHQHFQSLTLLPTVIVMVRDASNQFQPCRALLDSGSQGTLISEACVQRLRLKRTFDKTLIYGVGSSIGNCTKGKVHIYIQPSQSSTLVITEALCLHKVTQYLPTYEVTNDKLQFFNNLLLADPSFFKPGKIDIILGADIFTTCLLPEKLTHPSGSPTAINTVFGWIIMGKVSTSLQQPITIAHISLDVSQQLQRFWEVEDLQGPTKYLTLEEQKAEEHFQQHVQRDKSGRYMVRLPLKSDDVTLGESRTVALKRLYASERRLSSNPDLQQEYCKFMKEYLDLGHMEPSTDVETKRSYFMPHHAVLRPTSTTTKLRVVFDASCKTTNGLSLNDLLLVGPTIQRDLFEIIINFRKHKIGIAGDIEKMYRQVMVHPDDRSLQRILWRNSKDDQPKAYDLRTVTYGTSAAPFLAMRTLQQISFDNIDKYPVAAAAIQQNFYVDDFLACASSTLDAVKLKDDLCRILSKAGLHLRKWSSNSSQFLTSIPEEDREASLSTVIDATNTTKTLGLMWDTTNDSFKYSFKLSDSTHSITKRKVLSDIAKVFDPIGWLAPFTVTLKIFMQKLWVHGIDWDAELSDDLSNQWAQLRQNINNVSTICIPRWMKFTDEVYVELHGFSDASESAYAAAVYIRISHSNGDVFSSLLAAKTRVAPVKQITLPRLELCAAVLLIRLVTKLKDSLSLPQVKVFGWTDSSIVLAWLADHPRRWKTFVANRTAQIIDIIPSNDWRHIPSQHNPADLATRGINPTELIHNRLWWHGPDELSYEPTSYDVPALSDSIDMEERKNLVLLPIATTEAELIEKYSDFTQLLRVMAYVFRFINKARQAKQVRTTGTIPSQELKASHDKLVKIAQSTSYAYEILSLTRGKQLPTSHKLANLAPFTDNNGLLRVGGRICKANISYDQKHPLILHKDHHLTKLIIRQYHLRHLHAGNRQLHYLLGLRYWISGATTVIKQCLYKCITCMRQRGISYQQQMGNIPQQRLDPGSAFLNTGVDFAGPIMVRSWKGRGSRLYKCWIALFVCLVTKAIHIELVTELSTAAFIASLRRFIARRGKPLHIFSDNGTNFTGANQQLCELYQQFSTSVTQDNITKELAEQQIQWHFSPPAGPHFGGIWEAGIKSVKFHLKRVLGEASTTYEELATILCQIECCLNSRPLCSKFEGDIDPLTPAHFLILRSPASLPEENLLDLKENTLSRWQYVQRLTQQFWHKWSTQYISQLQKRPKWANKMKNIAIDDVVVIKDTNLPPTQWLIGRVIETHPGSDGLVRVATVKTAKGTFKRPVVKLCPMFVDG